MRTLLTVVTLLIALNATASGQSLMVERAEYRIGMTLDEMEQMAAKWGQKIEWGENTNSCYVVHDSIGLEWYHNICEIEHDAAKIISIEVDADDMEFIPAYMYLLQQREELSRKWGPPSANDLGAVHTDSEKPWVTISVEAKSWSLTLWIEHRPNEPSVCRVSTKVFKEE